MTRPFPFIYSLICGLLIISNSCKKSNDSYPEVIIVAPAKGSTYSYGDTIRVEAKIANWDGNYRLNISRNGIPLSLPWQTIPSQGGKEIFLLYYTDEYAEAGAYEIELVAYNGEVSRRDFVQVYLNEHPLIYEGMMVLSEAANTSELVYVNAANQLESESFYGDFHFLGKTVNPTLIIAAPENVGELRAYTIDPLQMQFEAFMPTNERFNDVFNAGQLVFVLAKNGEVRGYGGAGNLARQWSVPPDRVPVTGCYSSEGLLLCVSQRGVENYFLQLRNTINGALLKNRAIPGRATHIAEIGTGRYIAMLMSGNQTEIVRYETATNTLTTLFKLPGKPGAMLELEDRNVLLATEGEIHILDTKSGAFPTKLFNFGAVDMAYHKGTQEIYVATSSQVYRTTLQGGSTPVYSSPTPIYQIELLFNK